MSKGTSIGMEDLSQDDIGTIEETAEDAILSRQTSVNLVPFVGQRFISQEAAYEFYCSFAKQCGFSIRRHRTRGKDGVGRGVTRRDFTCHRGGYPQMKPSEDGKMQRNRKSSRCGCQAYMRIVKRADFDVPEWRITGFSNIHNHELLKSNEVCLLPAYCSLSTDDKSRICMFAKAGMSVRQMLRLMELEKGVKLGCLPFTEIDAFGDAVVFDTTRRLDAYDMLLGIWLGVDNHGMTCFFGCVLLRDENMQSFSWALKTFLGFMKGKAPQSILTDHNMWLKEAIAIDMPQSKHAFCIWHMVAKFSDWFSVLLGSRYDDWKAEFHRLFNLDLVEDFEERWREMVDEFELHTNKHVISLYALRNFWALAYLKHYFFAEMMSASQAESIDAFVLRFLSAQSQLDRFVEQAGAIVDYNDRVGAKQKMQRKLQRVCLKTGSPIESHAASVLTPYAFGKLQEELVLAPQYASFVVDEEGSFQVRHHTEANGGCKVIWMPCQEHISCSCYQFEFSGILCRHVLRVMSTNNCFHIPDQYLPARWCNVSSSSTNTFETGTMKDNSQKIQLLESMASTLVTESVETDERLDAACEQIAMVLSRVKELPRTMHNAIDIAYNCPSHTLILPDVEQADGIVRFTIGNESVTVGKLKERRPRDIVDITKKPRHCSGPCCLSVQ